MTTTFAERLRWSRYYGPAARKAGKQIGATLLGQKSGCAPSLISSLERQNARGSEYNNKFASVLGVDANWPATGEGDAPVGFDERVARELRTKQGSGLLTVAYSSTRLPTPSAGIASADVEASAEAAVTAVDRAAALQKALMANFIEFGTLCGREKAKSLAALLENFAESQFSEHAAREH